MEYQHDVAEDQSVDNLSDSDGSFEFINDTSDNVIYGIETKTWKHGLQNISPISLHDSEESNYSMTAMASSSNASFPSEDCPMSDESFELINEISEDLVLEKEPKKLFDSRYVSPNSASYLESHCDIAENKEFSPSLNVSILDMNSLSVDSDESFEVINQTPEKLLCSKESEQFFSPQDVTSSSISNMEPVRNIVFENKWSSTAEMSTNDDKHKQESQVLALIAERKKDTASRNIPGDSEWIFADGPTMKGLVKGIKNCAITDKYITSANKSHNDQFKANVLMHDEKPNPESKNLIAVLEEKCVSKSGNGSRAFRGNKEMHPDMKKVIKAIESCSIVDKQFNSNITFDKKLIDGLKINPIVNKNDLVSLKDNLTSKNTADEIYEPKCSEACMIAKGKIRSCDEPNHNAFEEEKREKVWTKELLSCRSLNIFVRPIPEAVFVLRSICLGYLKKLKQTNESNEGFKPDYSVYCSEQGNRIAQEYKKRDLSRELKDKMRKKAMENSADTWTNEKKDILSWRGFYIDF